MHVACFRILNKFGKKVSRHSAKFAVDPAGVKGHFSHMIPTAFTVVPIVTANVNHPYKPFGNLFWSFDLQGSKRSSEQKYRKLHVRYRLEEFVRQNSNLCLVLSNAQL